MAQEGERHGSSGRSRRGFSAFAESNLSIVQAQPEEEEEKVAARLDEPLSGLWEHLAGPRAELNAEVEAKLREYDAASGASLRHSHRETRSFVEHYERHTGLQRLREVIRKYFKALEVHEDDRPAERSNVWKVVGGDDGRDLIVRSGPSPNWPKLPDKLGVGSWIDEKEMVQDRIRYGLLWGTGPKTGWISVMLRDEVLAMKMEKMPQSLQSAAGVRKEDQFPAIAPLKQKAKFEELRLISEKLFGKAADEVAAKGKKLDKNPKTGKEEAIVATAPTVVTAREAVAAGEVLPLPPQYCARERIAVIGLMAAHVKDEAALARLYQVLRSAMKQESLEKHTEFIFVLSWFAPEGELSEAVSEKLVEFRELYGESRGKSWVDIPQSSPYSQFQHLRAALAQGERELMRRWQIEPNGAGGYSKQSVWVVFGDDDDLWHSRRVSAYMKAMRNHQTLDAVAAFASLGRVNVVKSARGSGKFVMPEEPSEVDDILLGGKQLYRLDDMAECQKAWKSLSDKDRACDMDVALDLPMEYFDFCPRLRVFREFLDGASEELLAHHYCDIAFLKYMRNYAAYGREIGLEVSYFKPTSWMYFYANPGSSAAFSRSIMSAPSIVLRSVTGPYLSVLPNRTVGTAVQAGENEELLRVANDDGTTSFLSHEGWYLSVGADGYCYMDGASAGLAEKFDLLEYGSDDGGIAMVSLWNVKYMSFLIVETDGGVKAFHQESDPPGRILYLEVSKKSEVIGEDNGHVTATVKLRSGELEFARQECGLFASYDPGLLPEKLARLFAVFRNGIELSLVEFHRKVFDQPEFATLVFEVAHMVFDSVFSRIAALPVSERHKASRSIYEVLQRFATLLASELEVKVLWHKSDVFMVPSDKLMKVWLKYRK